MKATAYVDGFNLYYGAVKDTPYRWLDIAAMYGLLLPREHIGGNTRSVVGFPPQAVPRTGALGELATARLSSRRSLIE